MPLKSPRQLSLPPSFPFGCHPPFSEKVPLILRSIREGLQRRKRTSVQGSLCSGTRLRSGRWKSVEGLAADVRDSAIFLKTLGGSHDARDHEPERCVMRLWPPITHIRVTSTPPQERATQPYCGTWRRRSRAWFTPRSSGIVSLFDQ